jgi:hypothetical protein
MRATNEQTVNAPRPNTVTRAPLIPCELRRHAASARHASRFPFIVFRHGQYREDRMKWTTKTRGRARALLPTIAVLIASVGFAACNDDDDIVGINPTAVTTFNDASFNFATLHTFAMPDTVVHFNPLTGTPLTASSASAMGQQMSIFERTSGTNLSWGLVLSNTTSVITVPAWYKVSDGSAGQAPANTETYVIRPAMWDHKVFAAINVINGDSIQYTYTLTINSGG